MLSRLAILTTLGAVLAFPAFSQDDPPPGRVARLGYLAGTVSFQPASVEDWTPAELNHPVVLGDHIWTEADGLVELQTNNASVRLAGRTNFSFLNLSDTVTQIEITTGTLNVRLHTLAPNEGFEIDTPQLSFTLLRNGDYRIDVTEAGDATITTVRAGDAEINMGDKATAIHLGMMARATGTEANAVLEAPHPLGPADRFDAFCMDRDRREEAVVAARYVSRDVPGYADLDGFGGWRVHPAYGNVWFPSGLVAGWAPYRFGHFGWLEPYGWTWIDDAPWGWAPFHFGRWVVVDGAWGWVPGTIVVRPVFAPALVAFGDFPVGVVVAEPVVGWFPLGFGEVYVPPFAVAPAYLASFNVGIVIGAGFSVGGYHYMHRDGYMTAMRHGDFEHGRALHGDHLRVGREHMARGRFGDHAGINPHRDAVMGHRGAARGIPPRGVGERGIQAHRGVPNRPASFDRGASARAAHPGQAMRGSERASMGRPNSNVHGAGGARGNSMAGNHGPAGGSRGPSAGSRGPSAANHGPAGGSRGPNAGGSRGPSAGASRGPSAGASRGPSAGASRGPSAGASRGPSAGASRGPSAGASRGPSAGASRGPSAGASRGPSSPSAGGRPGGAPAAGGRPGGAPAAGGRPGGTPTAGGRPGGAPTAGGRPGGAPGGGAMGGRPGGAPGGGAAGGRPGGAPGGGGRPGGAPSGGGHPSAPAAAPKHK
ncbi:MAG TPA: DUF6600 domain-containing protein [Bryobacteraceae bacterium]|nr:DUF6600 domain-containing protein [Bryobacteraceae bacterium]